MNWMLLKLFRIPIFLFICSFAFLFIAMNGFDGMGHSTLFSGISDLFIKGTALLSIVLFSISVIWTIYCGYRLWCWEKGSGDFCNNCGGITEYKNGRYGPYQKCLMCRTNKSI